MYAFDLFLKKGLPNCALSISFAVYLFLPPFGVSVGCSPISLSRFYVLRRNAVLLFQ